MKELNESQQGWNRIRAVRNLLGAFIHGEV